MWLYHSHSSPDSSGALHALKLLTHNSGAVHLSSATCWSNRLTLMQSRSGCSRTFRTSGSINVWQTVELPPEAADLLHAITHTYLHRALTPGELEPKPEMSQKPKTDGDAPVTRGLRHSPTAGSTDTHRQPASWIAGAHEGERSPREFSFVKSILRTSFADNGVTGGHIIGGNRTSGRGSGAKSEWSHIALRLPTDVSDRCARRGCKLRHNVALIPSLCMWNQGEHHILKESECGTKGTTTV